LQRIFALSRGVPAAVNRMCDRSLTLGCQSSASVIDRDFVEEAARDLGLSPAGGADSVRDRAMIVMLMIALVLAGAAGAGWVFREPLGRALTQFSAGHR